MALKPCPECGKEVSSKAPTCPHCGSPIAGDSIVNAATVHGRGEGIFMKSLNCGCMIALAFAALVVVIVVIAIGNVSSDNTTAADSIPAASP